MKNGETFSGSAAAWALVASIFLFACTLVMYITDKSLPEIWRIICAGW
jgi:hypothetical protein